jgi:hypothetical protein
MIAAEGLKDVMASMSTDIDALQQRERAIQIEINELNKSLKVDAKRKKEIVRYYQERMAEFLNLLNVNVLKLDDYKTLQKQVGTNALGSDLSRSLLAQSFSFIHAMNKFNNFVMCPLVIDSPFQQEQDDTNVDAIFKFIFSKVLPQQQLILATLTVTTAAEGVLPQGAKEVHFVDELGLLQRDQYADVLNHIGPMHDATLAEK